MARVRNNQGYRKKVLDIFIRPYLEQENTQEREALQIATKAILNVELNGLTSAKSGFQIVV